MPENQQQEQMSTAQRVWRRLTDEFDAESDRAAALVAAALLDQNLEDLLRAFMVDDQRETGYILGTNLQSLGSRVRACYCLGLISLGEAHDLRVVKEIRNHFAHNLHVSFQDAKVQSNCQKLRMVQRMLPEGARLSPRRMLEQSTCILSVLLVARCRSIASERRRKRRDSRVPDLAAQCPLTLSEVERHPSQR